MAASLPGGDHRHHVSDLAVSGAGAQLIAAAGEIDGIVANAGLGANGKVDGYSAEQIESVVRVNLEAPIQMVREAAPALRGRGEGHIVFVASLAGKAATPRGALYAATKAGLAPSRSGCAATSPAMASASRSSAPASSARRACSPTPATRRR